MIAIDTETALISEAEPTPRLVSVAFANDRYSELMAAHDPIVADTLENALQHGACFANAPFDIFVILRAFPHLLDAVIDAYQHGRIADVLTRERMISIASGEFENRFGLGDVAMRRAGIELDKDDPWRTRYAELLGLEISAWPKAAITYAINDVMATYAVWQAQEPYAEALPDQARQARSHLALYAQTLKGIHTDLAQVYTLDREMVHEIDRLAVLLVGHGLARVQGKAKPKITRDTKAAMGIAKSWASEHGRPVEETSRGVSLKESALEALALPEGHPLHSYQRYGSLRALRKKNIPALSAPIVRTRYTEVLATGRTGSSAPGGPWVGTNLQNLPREGGFRECLIPPPGWKFVVSDWSMAELVALAQTQIDWFGRSELGDVLNEGRDPHAELGAKIAGRPFIDDADRKKYRTLAKAPNFGFPGGLGATRFVGFARGTYGIILSEAEARRLKRLWQQQWPVMRDYHERIDRKRGPDGKITMVLDRTGFIRGGCTFNQACNLPFQALAAAAAKDALWSLWRAFQDPDSPLFSCHQVLFVHDENVIACPAERAAVVLAEVERIMIAAFARLCPDVPVGVESHILDRYAKV